MNYDSLRCQSIAPQPNRVGSLQQCTLSKNHPGEHRSGVVIWATPSEHVSWTPAKGWPHHD